MTRVRVIGSLVDRDGSRVVVPTAPSLDPFSPHAIVLRGQYPPIGRRVSLIGELSEGYLEVAAFEVLPGPLGEAWSTPDVDGVSDDIAQRVARSFPEEWGLISGGVSTTTYQNRVAIIEVARLTPRIASWQTQQPPGSLILIPFVASADL